MRRRLLVVAVLAMVTTTGRVLAGDGPLFLWRAERGDARVWLLGSVHIGSADFYPLDARITAALAEADTVACEVDMTDPVKAGQAALLAMQKGTYPAGQSLREHVSAATWQRVVAMLDSLQAPTTLVDRMRPALAGVTLLAWQLQQQGLDPDQGIDRYVLEQAHTARKPIVDLETVPQQVDLLLGQDPRIGELLLQESLAQTETAAVLDSMLAAWQQGDAAAMARLEAAQWLDDPLLVDYHEAVVAERNAAMAANLDRRARSGDGVWFVVIGAAHLVGDRGMPALLAARGWRVAQVGEKR